MALNNSGYTLKHTNTHEAIMNEKRAASPREIADLFGLSVGTLSNMRGRNEGPAYHKAGKRKILYFLEDVEQWLRGKTPNTICGSMQYECRGKQSRY